MALIGCLALAPYFTWALTGILIPVCGSFERLADHLASSSYFILLDQVYLYETSSEVSSTIHSLFPSLPFCDVLLVLMKIKSPLFHLKIETVKNQSKSYEIECVSLGFFFFLYFLSV